jgi:hypothetical protein
MRHIPHSEELAVPKPLENLTFSDENSDSDKDHKHCDLTFEASCSLSEPHLLTQGDLNDLVCGLNLSKKEAELVGSRLNGWNLLHHYTEIHYVTFEIVIKNSKKFSLKKMIWYFVIMSALL